MTIYRTEYITGWQSRKIDIDEDFVEYFNEAVNKNWNINGYVITAEDIEAIILGNNIELGNKLYDMEASFIRYTAISSVGDVIYDMFDNLSYDYEIYDDSTSITDVSYDNYDD